MNKELNDISLRTKRTHATQCDEEGGLTLLFDFGGTLDTAGCHWGKFLWYAYKRNGIPVTEEQFREDLCTCRTYLREAAYYTVTRHISFDVNV